MHPRWLRCSSLKYSRYSQSSRLAIGAPRPSRCDAGRSARTVKGASNIVNLETAATALRDEFIGWQCRVRRQAMREAGGRPSEGMCPRVLDPTGTTVANAITILLARIDADTIARTFEFQFKRTHDPLDRYEKAVTTLAAEYYQHPRHFTGVMSALFGGGSPTLEWLVASRRCVLVFHEFTHGYRVPCDVEQLASEDALFKSTYWHNAMFNPNLPPDIAVVAFTPDWTHASRYREELLL
jgi:hypothetical protein